MNLHRFGAYALQKSVQIHIDFGSGRRVEGICFGSCSDAVIEKHFEGFVCVDHLDLEVVFESQNREASV